MKKRSAKILLFLPLMIAAILFGGARAYAEEKEDISELAEDYNVSSAADGLDYGAAEFLAENGITPDNADGITDLTPQTVIAYMWEKLKHSAVGPLRIFGVMISVIILSAAGGAAADAVSGGSEKIYRIVTVLIAVSVIIPPLEKCFLSAADTLEKGGDFMLCYVPVFAGICTAAGNVTAAVSYNMIVLLLAEAAVRLVSELIMPVISVCMAMNIIDAINPSFSLSSLTGLLKKWTTLFLGFVMTIFSGLLSIQSIVGVSADTIGIKAAKFLVSNFVPVVGGAVADAYTTMRSGLGLLRGAAGAFGIIALAVMLLPPIIEIGCMYFAMTAGEAIAEMFGAKELGVLFRGAASALSLVSAVLACFGVMFIIATIILMAAGLGTS